MQSAEIAKTVILSPLGLKRQKEGKNRQEIPNILDICHHPPYRNNGLTVRSAHLSFVSDVAAALVFFKL